MKKLPDNLAARTWISVLLLPAATAIIVPVLIMIIDPWRQPVFWPGLVPLAAGIYLTAASIREFIVHGEGTLAPWDTPVNLVVTGPYRYCRNPMYTGILVLITGLVLFFTSPLLLLYEVITAAAFHLRVVRCEEPQLARQFGQRWVVYSAMVSRWMPKIP